MKRNPFEKVKLVIEQNGCILLTLPEEYQNNRTLLKILCYCGSNTFETSYHSFTNKQTGGKTCCDQCSLEKQREKTKKDFQSVWDAFIQNDFTPLFEEKDYINAKKSLPYICNIHKDKGVQYARYDNVRSGKACKYCKADKASKTSRLNFAKVAIKEYEENGLVPLFNPEEYIDVDTKMPCICKIHSYEVQYISYTTVKYRTGCYICGKEKYNTHRKKEFDEVLNAFTRINFTPLFVENDYSSNTDKLPYICNNHPELGIQYMCYADVRTNKGCQRCAYDRITGENHYNYKGGVSPLHNFLRDKIYSWKIEILKEYGFKCWISGSKKDLQIHHLYNFTKIMNETLSELGLVIRNSVSQYTEDEIDSIINLIIKKHESVNGVPLTKEFHFLFHRLYGKEDNDINQLQEFKKRYELGEFKNIA